MSRECAQVPGPTSVQHFVDEFLLRTGRRCFFVTVRDSIAGLITSHEVRAIDRSLWAVTSVQQIMKPLDKVRAVAPETVAMEALELMAREDLNQLRLSPTTAWRGCFQQQHPGGAAIAAGTQGQCETEFLSHQILYFSLEFIHRAATQSSFVIEVRSGR